MSSICLNMIVKDESAVIARCLQSVKPYIDYWVIVDTGSNDNTAEVIQAELSGIPGELHHRTFDNFSESRNHALIEAENDCDYLLLIDADMVLNVEDDSFKEKLELDGYYLPVHEAQTYHNIRLIKNDLLWQYVGRTHEFIVSQDAGSIATHPDLSITHLLDGSSRTEKNQRDKNLLELTLQEDANDTHALFYLGRIAINEEQWIDALKYLNRMLYQEHHWDPEWVWYARHMRGKLMEKLDYDFDSVTSSYLSAYESRPQRAESLYDLARYCRESDRLALAEMYGSRAAELPVPDELFDLDKTLYSWNIPAEYAFICYRLGLHQKTVTAANQALQEVRATRNSRDALLASRQRSLEILNESRKLTEAGSDRNTIKVVVPFRNAGEFLMASIESLQQQDYDNFSACFIDDCSDDGSGDLVPTDDERFVLQRNVERVGPLINRSEFIFNCDPNDIILYLDGDDQLASDDALSYINSVYNEYGCWMTYGQFISQNGNLGWAKPYSTPLDLDKELMYGGMKFPIHPITHRAGLLQRLKDHDPELECFKDEQGEWLFYASDAVLARPLFCMAGWDRVLYLNRVLYLYTEGHEISESIHNKDDQLETCRIVNSKMRPPRLTDYRPSV
ncbi:MAG: glycosyltransferase [Pseudomonadota bacterium]